MDPQGKTVSKPPAGLLSSVDTQSHDFRTPISLRCTMLMPGTFIGYDPGGAKTNGAAIIRVETPGAIRAEVMTGESVDEVIDWLSEKERGTVVAAGIDTLLCWGTGPSGWRPMDNHLKEKYPTVSQSVVSSNGLYGAMAIQGMAMALKLRAKWPDMHLNETHPKVQYYAQAGNKYHFSSKMVDWLQAQFNSYSFPSIANEHQWDALYSAWVTLKGLSNGEQDDLIEVTGARDVLVFPVGNVSYFWL